MRRVRCKVCNEMVDRCDALSYARAKWAIKYQYKTGYHVYVCCNCYVKFMVERKL
jgi:hypothetical protein